jgi:hypothetical protein
MLMYRLSGSAATKRIGLMQVGGRDLFRTSSEYKLSARALYLRAQVFEIAQ